MQGTRNQVSRERDQVSGFRLQASEKKLQVPGIGNQESGFGKDNTKIRNEESNQIKTPGEGILMNFEDLEIWKRSKDLSVDIYRKLRALRDYGFKDQITRAGLSVPSNIARPVN